MRHVIASDHCFNEERRRNPMAFRRPFGMRGAQFHLVNDGSTDATGRIPPGSRRSFARTIRRHDSRPFRRPLERSERTPLGRNDRPDPSARQLASQPPSRQASENGRLAHRPGTPRWYYPLRFI